VDEREFVIRKTKALEGLTPEEYSDFYRTKDMYCAAFLISRGFEWTNLELVEVIKKNNKFSGSELKKKFIFFLFPNRNKCEHMALNYFNGNRVNLNVNANSFVQSILNVRSIITNPPFN
jgi:hypothetical protein